jgi:hypothetical protein
MPQANDKPKLLKQRVVISRRWSHPAIDCKITEDEINMSMELSAFQAALIAAIGTPAFRLTRGARRRWLKARMDKAFVEIVDEVKKASVYVV